MSVNLRKTPWHQISAPFTTDLLGGLPGGMLRPFHPGEAAQLQAYFSQENYAFVPRVEVVECDGEVRVSAELPGLDEKMIHLTVTPSSVLLTGTKEREDGEEEEPRFARSERLYGNFQREVPLPVEVEVDKADARLENGVLTVVLKKSAQANSHSRKVTVKSV